MTTHHNERNRVDTSTTPMSGGTLCEWGDPSDEPALVYVGGLALCRGCGSIRLAQLLRKLPNADRYYKDVEGGVSKRPESPRESASRSPLTKATGRVEPPASTNPDTYYDLLRFYQ